MELQDLVCDIEYAKKLNELGLKQNSIFSYFMEYKGNQTFNPMLLSTEDMLVYKVKTMCANDTYSAFTTDELLEMLPRDISIDDTPLWINISKDYYDKQSESGDIYYEVCYSGNGISTEKIKDDKLPNALAKMLIWIMENGYMEVER